MSGYVQAHGAQAKAMRGLVFMSRTSFLSIEVVGRLPGNNQPIDIPPTSSNTTFVYNACPNRTDFF